MSASLAEVIMPKIEAESIWPDPMQLQLVESCARRLKPDGHELEAWVADYARDHCDRIAFDLAMIEKYLKKGDRIVEFGSIPLLLTAALKDKGYDIKGVDIDPSRFSSVIDELNLDIARCNIETESIPMTADSADVAIFNELFEHLRINPVFTMREVHRILRHDGVLLLSTPNLRSLSGLVNFLIKNRAYSCAENVYDEYAKLETLGHMGHTREYTTREVSEFLSTIGFRVEVLVFRGRYDRIRVPGLSPRLAARCVRPVTRLLPRLRPFVTYVARADKGAPA